VNRPSFEGGDGIVDVARLVERIGVDRDLNVLLFSDPQTAVDRAGCGTPVLVQLQADGTSSDLLDEPLRGGAVDRKSVV